MRHLLGSAGIVGIIAVGLALGGCDNQRQATHDQPGGVQSPEAPPAPPVAPPTAATPASPAPLATLPPGGIEGTRLDDAQTLAVLAAVNSAAVQEARVASARATAKEVKAFAADVATTHQAMLDRATINRSRHSVTPVDSVTSDEIQADVGRELTALRDLPAARFDAAYVDDQVAANKRTLVILDQVIPDLQDGWLRDDLARDREQFKGELMDALRLQDQLRPGNTSMQGSGKTKGSGTPAPH